MSTTPLLITLREAASQLSLSRRSVERLIATGRLPSRRMGRRRLVPAEALRRLARQDVPVIAAPRGAL